MLKKLLYGFVLLTAVAVVYGISVQPKHIAEAPAVEQPDPARLTVAAGAVQLKRMAHDPASFELVQALQMPDGIGCYTYRAKNGFGAMRTGNAVLHGGKVTTSETDGFATIWNRYCGGREGVALK